MLQSLLLLDCLYDSDNNDGNSDDDMVQASHCLQHRGCNDDDGDSNDNGNDCRNDIVMMMVVKIVEAK
jgi:hypothetical protein